MLDREDRDFREDAQIMNIFAEYSEPFYCECRAYGRLKETGREDLTVKSFGYIFLNEEHERIMMKQFGNHSLYFNGSMDNESSDEWNRCRFVGKDERAPPIRGIVKELGQGTENLTTPLAKSLLKDIKEFQRLGIISLDVALRQVINGKLSDFSQAITIPHYRTNPELNPNPLPPKLACLIWPDIFSFSSRDYWNFDDMVNEWNEDNNGNIKVYANPGGKGCDPKHQYNLRKKTMYTFVDPRKLEGVKKKRKREMWVIQADEDMIRRFRGGRGGVHLFWGLRDGYIVPKIGRWLY